MYTHILCVLNFTIYLCVCLYGRIFLYVQVPMESERVLDPLELETLCESLNIGDRNQIQVLCGSIKYSQQLSQLSGPSCLILK